MVGHQPFANQYITLVAQNGHYSAISTEQSFIIFYYDNYQTLLMLIL